VERDPFNRLKRTPLRKHKVAVDRIAFRAQGKARLPRLALSTKSASAKPKNALASAKPNAINGAIIPLEAVDRTGFLPRSDRISARLWQTQRRRGTLLCNLALKARENEAPLPLPLYRLPDRTNAGYHRFGPSLSA
jgi:hypothetical protein